MQIKLDLMEKIVSLCKRRGFVFPGSEIYGGLANSWDYGPLGVELKNNIKQLWWKRFVHNRDDIVGIDSALIMNPKVWQASGHLKNFKDPLKECKRCHQRFRADEIGAVCPNCQASDWSETRDFNLMFKTFLGPIENSFNTVYLRPETAQGMFVQFKNILQTTRRALPFGIAQQGKAFRNEITPGNFIFRQREFEQMEIEYFVHPHEWEKWFEYWKAQHQSWLKEIGVEQNAVFVEIPQSDRAHYSKRSVDIEYKFPFGQKELYGLAYRTDYDLKNHMQTSGKDLQYTDPQTGEKFIPHVIEPTWGVDRTILAVLCSSYDDTDKKRLVLHLPPKLAPYKVAVFPLLKNKPELVTAARNIYDALRLHFATDWDDRGNVGKRYYAQDEIGTPYCVTVDFQTLEDHTITIRDRDTAKQERIKIDKIKDFIAGKLQE
jgi:glycyl-tRNA synthetase